MATGDWGTADLGGTIGILEAGARLRVAHWPGAADGPGTVILVQGFGEFIEVYAETIADLRARGYAVVAFDFRGQGGSERKIAFGTHLRAFRDHVDDLLAVVRFAAERELPRPFMIAAHSMGGLVALSATRALAHEVARIVCFAPFLGLARPPVPEGLAAALAGLVCGLGFARRPVARNLSGARDPASNHLTSDADRYRALCDLIDANPALVSGPPTFGWVRQMFQATASLRSRSGSPLSVPALVVGSGRDTLVSTRAAERFAREVPGGGFVLVGDARHHILLERDALRGAALAAFDAFVESAAQEAPPVPATARRAGTRKKPLAFTLVRQSDAPAPAAGGGVAPLPAADRWPPEPPAPTAAAADVADTRAEPVPRPPRRTRPVTDDMTEDALLRARRRAAAPTNAAPPIAPKADAAPPAALTADAASPVAPKADAAPPVAREADAAAPAAPAADAAPPASGAATAATGSLKGDAQETGPAADRVSRADDDALFRARRRPTRLLKRGRSTGAAEDGGDSGDRSDREDDAAADTPPAPPIPAARRPGEESAVLTARRPPAAPRRGRASDGRPSLRSTLLDKRR